MVTLYKTIDRSTSGHAAQTSLDALNRYVRVNADGDVYGLNFGPDADDLLQAHIRHLGRTCNGENSAEIAAELAHYFKLG